VSYGVLVAWRLAERLEEWEADRAAAERELKLGRLSVSYRPKPTPKPPQPPRWERAIVETLRRVPAFYLGDLAPGASPEDLAELRAVAAALEAAGKIALQRWQGTPSVAIVYRPTDGTPDPARIARLNR
jgi:hypothetical protein